MKAAIITGATGQDGSYLCELLLEKGYHVKCLVRRSTYPIETGNLKFKHDALQIYEGDVLDHTIIQKMIQECEDYERVEIYNLAAQSHVHTSFNCPRYTFETNTLGVLNILESVRQSKVSEKYRIYQASTSEMFGKVQETPQRETTPFIRVRSMASQRWPPTGSSRITESRMDCLRVRAFSSITKALAAA